MRGVRTLRRAARLIPLLVLLSVTGVAPGSPPAQHGSPPPPPFDDGGSASAALAADAGMQIERNRPPQFALAQHTRLAVALAGLKPQRRGTVDVYVLVAALDSDPVFGREARATGRVLARRYAAAGRTIVLAADDGRGGEMLAHGSPVAIEAALARIAELIDPAEDVVVLYTTSHGSPIGIVYQDGSAGFGAISPMRLAAMLDGLGIRRRMLLISACYAGVFVPMLGDEDSVIASAASATTTSFGCRAENDWTFFGDALINRALRKPQGLPAAFAEADAEIAAWERGGGIEPARPQLHIGSRAGRWLAAIEARLPPADAPIGRPATDALRAP